ncbi:PAAR domain-containing protein [Pseudomonas sp. 13B_2.1_Bac1]|uniref:PAAR domain-containing protein n=1 Tax=Pseudomonas sp. 13B_2.1_Bac1 TaxID=2971624 RepID=UPI0021C6979F|nr:PAAR domain-containing protein [Pseudomonas sp. 13B_2.1_Bac1]MCU1782058.1 PAAR domain-containing protein [Pseudomonas sp. 13B_2.1_Bac1]
MPAVVLVGHDHDCPLCGPATVKSGLHNVTVNGRAVARVGDSTDPKGILKNIDASWLIN